MKFTGHWLRCSPTSNVTTLLSQMQQRSLPKVFDISLSFNLTWLLLTFYFHHMLVLVPIKPNNAKTQ